MVWPHLNNHQTYLTSHVGLFQSISKQFARQRSLQDCGRIGNGEGARHLLLRSAECGRWRRSGRGRRRGHEEDAAASA